MDLVRALQRAARQSASHISRWPSEKIQGVVVATVVVGFGAMTLAQSSAAPERLGVRPMLPASRPVVFFEHEVNQVDQADEAALDYEVQAFEAQLRKESPELAASSDQVTAPGISCAEADTSSDKVACLRSSLNELKARREQAEARAKSRPSIPPVYGVVTSPFGPRRSPFAKKTWVFHAGVDIGTPRESLFVAPADGVVTAVEHQTGYGPILTLDHGNGIQTKYAHATQFFVAEGAKVKRGEALGLVGEKGKTTGPNLHYEVWVGGKPTDPMAFMALPNSKEMTKLFAGKTKYRTQDD